jgi:Zn-dependent protease with chaperone function
MTVGVDFDLARYIQEKRGQVMLRIRLGAAYSYAGERSVRHTLMGTRPVAMAIEATTRLWRDVARTELLGTSTKVTDEVHPRVHAAVVRAADMLKVKAPAVYIAPAGWSLRARALGTDEAPYIVVRADVAEKLSDTELVAAIGHELGHVQNGHVLYATALHYLTHSAVFFVRWIVQPAIMTLQAWSRRAEITCDRAALLASRDLDATIRAIARIELGVDANVDELPTESKKGIGKVAELFRSNPYLPKRIAALRLFADSVFYAAATGADPSGKVTAEEVDKKVAEFLAVW